MDTQDSAQKKPYAKPQLTALGEQSSFERAGAALKAIADQQSSVDYARAKNARSATGALELLDAG